MMSSQAVYCLNLQIQSNCDENGKTVSTRNQQHSNEMSKQSCITMDSSSSSDAPSPLHKAIVQHNSSQSIFDTGQSQQSTGSTNNIILLRGSRNENGQIIIQNKHDVISFINEEDKPLILHTPRKTNNGGGNSSTSTGGGGGGGGNTILLQTPINANQLESVLLQSASMKKGNLGERSFLIQKQPSRTYSTDGNRLTTTTTLSGANAKGPFILQTLKRLEKSQSILVIRNSSANTSNSNNNTSTVTSSDVTTAGNVNTATSTPPLATSSSLPSSLAFSRVTTTPQSTQTGLLKQTSSVSVTTGPAGASIPSRVKSTNARLGIIQQQQQQHANNNNKGNNTGNNYSRNPRNSLHGAGGGGVGSGVGTGGAGTAVSLDEVQNKLEAAGQQKKTNVPLGSDGEPIKLPDNLESLPRADSFPSQRHRWNTNEEIAAILISFDKHSEWQSKEVKTRPKSGSLLLYSRKKVRYRRDGYCWKKRKDGKTTREDHMKLKVQGTECIYGCYVHSAILPTFHRRCYWLLQNPDIVLVHYLNVPYPDDNKMAVIAPSLTLWGDKKEWTKEELVSQLKPMLSTVFSDEDSDSGTDIEISNAETVESIVSQLMEKQRLARQAALVKQLECGCPDSTCADGKSCSHPMRRIGIMKTLTEKRNDAYNQVTSTTPNVLIGAKLYSRWPERKTRLEMVTAEAVEHHERQNGEIKFQVIPSHMEQQQQQQQQQHQQHQQFNITRHTQMFAGRNNLIATPTQGPGGGGVSISGGSGNTSNVNAANFNQQSFANASNQNNQMNLNRNNINQIIINQQQQQQQQQQSHLVGGVGNNIITTTKTVTTFSGAGTGSTSATHNSSQNNNNNNQQQQQQLSVMSPQQISLQNSNERNELNSNNSINPSQGHIQHQQPSQHQLQHHHHQHHQQQQQAQKQQTNDLNMSLGGNPSSSSQTEHHSFKQQHQQHHQQQQQHHHLLRASLASTTPSITTISGVSAASTSTHSNKSQQHPNQTHTHHQQQLDQQQSQQHQHPHHIHRPSQQHQQQQQQQTLIECNDINQGQQSSNLISNTSDDNGNRMGSDTGTAVNVVGEVGSSGGQGSQPMSTDLGGSMLNLSQDADHLLDASELDVSDTGFHGLQQSTCVDNSANNVISASTHQSSPLQDKKEPSPSASSSERTATSDVSDSLSFFNETLDLSQEDIQRTLIANMPFGGSSDVVVNNHHHHHDDRVTSDLNPMDFIANVCDVTNGAKRSSRGGVGAIGIHDDDENEDVFVNLDAFDMLVEFPELEFDGKHESESSLSFDSSLSRVFSNSNRRILTISDYSPEWAYPEGGVKVLVTGPWKLSSTYTVLFDSMPVPTILVQEGVLRCFCPAHEVGLATLQIASDGYVISNSVIFEYKSSPNPEATFDGTTNDCLYKFTLLNRLSSIDEKMQIKMEPKESPEDAAFMMQSNFEERMVNYCHQLTNKLWRSNTPVSWTSSGFKGMTLLHLAAALGYAKLVCAMLSWRTENPNFILETEIDALSQDVYGYTPMTWACARGHTETALILYKFNHNAMKIKNLCLQTPMDVAKSKGFKYLLSELSRLESEKNKNQNDRSITYDFSKQLKQNNSSDMLNGQTIKDEITGSNNSDNSSDSQNTDASDINRSHDGVFLRPIAVASNQSPPTNSRYSKRSSIDSGINMDMRSFTKCGKPFKDQNKLTSFDCNDNYSLSVDSTFDGFSGLTSSSSLLSPLRKMDFALCEVSTCSSSPLADKNDGDMSDNEDDPDVTCKKDSEASVGESDAKVLTLAEHIIAAMPERIKNESDEMMILGSPMSESLHGDNTGISNMQDSFMDPLLDSLPNTHFDNDFNFDFSDHNYRYHDVSTPCSSLSPASSGPLQSPASYSIPPDPPMNSPSPPPSTKQLTEFLQASNNAQRPFEADFSKLTLTDSEQRELYEAAKCIQKAYRSYKGRQKMEEQNKERSAAIVIQNYYRRYKQYAYFRQMTNAALVIQHGYRSYCKNKRFKKSPHSNSLSPGNNLTSSYSESSSQCLSSYYYQQQEVSQPTTPKETSPSGPLKRTYSQSTQNQAARKIQQFMRQSKLKLQRERAEKERLVHQRREEYLQNLQYREQLETAHNQGQSEML